MYIVTNIASKLKNLHLNKVYHSILITGSGSGLGKEAAIRLSKRGHIVYASCLYEDEVAKLNDVAIKNNLQRNLKPFKLDILDLNDRKKIMNIKFDRYISNAAIGDSGSICEVDIERIRNVLETNLFASLELLQMVINKWTEEHIDARLIILSSKAGRIAIPFLGPYSISKFAIEAYSECLRFELKFIKEANIGICMIEPGAYATGFNKENIEKMYTWMEKKSYFKYMLPTFRKYYQKFWNFIEVKPFTSITNKYIKAVESKICKFRYSAPLLQAIAIQIARIFGR